MDSEEPRRGPGRPRLYLNDTERVAAHRKRQVRLIRQVEELVETVRQAAEEGDYEAKALTEEMAALRAQQHGWGEDRELLMEALVVRWTARLDSCRGRIRVVTGSAESDPTADAVIPRTFLVETQRELAMEDHARRTGEWALSQERERQRRKQNPLEPRG